MLLSLTHVSRGFKKPPSISLNSLQKNNVVFISTEGSDVAVILRVQKTCQQKMTTKQRTKESHDMRINS